MREEESKGGGGYICCILYTTLESILRDESPGRLLQVFTDVDQFHPGLQPPLDVLPRLPVSGHRGNDN